MGEYTVESIRAELNTLVLGRKIELHTQVGSTNDLVKEAARRGELEGLVVLAEEQVRGRGRLGRTWAAPPGSSILCSLLLRPRFSPEQAFYLTIATALAIHRSVNSLIDEGRRAKDDERARVNINPRSGYPLSDINPHSAVKWPNDVLVNGRKVSGVLCESEFAGGEWAFAVVGFGINVNLEPGDLEDLREIAPQATSLRAELGVTVDRAWLLGRMLGEFEGLYMALQSGQFGAMYKEWADTLETVGRRVSVNYGSGTISGQALRVENDGSLVVKTEAGVEWQIMAGDVVA